jgi:dTDP-glucose 4,6-dehydratase
MNLLVTGGAGFIGSNFLNSLLHSAKWRRIVILDALTYAGNKDNLNGVLQDPKFQFVHGDIRDEKIVSELMKDVNQVVHFAAESHVDRSIADPKAFVTTNILGTYNLLEAALQNRVQKFIHVSTDEVYGSIEYGSWSEESPVKPNSPYSASKASSDLLALSYFKTYNFPVIVTRCSNNYGKFQYLEKLIPLAITNLIDDKPIPIYGDGVNSRDWLNVSDHCRAISLIIENGKPGNVYNIGGGTELSNLQLAKILINIFGRDNSYINFVPDRKGHDRRYSVSFEKIRQECGYQPIFQFEESLVATVQWYQDNENWWRPLKARVDSKL